MLSKLADLRFHLGRLSPEYTGFDILSFIPTIGQRASPAQSRFSGKFWGRTCLLLKHSLVEGADTAADMATDGDHSREVRLKPVGERAYSRQNNAPQRCPGSNLQYL